MADKKETALVPIEDYAIAGRDPKELADIIKSNLGNTALTQFNLLRIKVPGGESTFFEIEGEAVKELYGVPVKFDDQKAYWEESFGSSGGGSPPDCHSDDGYAGIGKPGGDCSKCAFNVFGSAVNDKGKPTKGKACKDVRVIFLMMPGELLPAVLVVPPSSIGNAKEYNMRLVSKAISYTDIVMKVTLKTDKSDDGIKFPKMIFGRGPVLDKEQCKQFAAYRETVVGSLQAIDITPSDTNATNMDDAREANKGEE